MVSRDEHPPPPPLGRNLHLVVENFGLSHYCSGDQVLVQYNQNIVADRFQLVFNLQTQD